MKFEHKIIKTNYLLKFFMDVLKKYRIYKYFRQANLF